MLNQRDFAFGQSYEKFGQKFHSIINLEYQLSRISDEEFKEILKNMLSNESEINQIFDELQKEKDISDFKHEMNSFLEIKDYLNELKKFVKNFDFEENKAGEENSPSNKIDLEKSQEISSKLATNPNK